MLLPCTMHHPSFKFFKILPFKHNTNLTQSKNCPDATAGMRWMQTLTQLTSTVFCVVVL